MTPAIKQWVKDKITTGVLPKTRSILEIGSRDVNGSVRDLFEGQYVGVDIVPGAGVDVVHDITVKTHPLSPVSLLVTYDLVICLETLEHIPRFWRALAFIQDRIRSGGLFLVSVPTTGFPEHRHPQDCYRFMRDAMTDVFFRDMEVIALDEVTCPAGYPGLIGIGKKL